MAIDLQSIFDRDTDPGFDGLAGMRRRRRNDPYGIDPRGDFVDPDSANAEPTVKAPAVGSESTTSTTVPASGDKGAATDPDFSYQPGPAMSRYKQDLENEQEPDVPELKHSGKLGKTLGILSQIFLGTNIPEELNTMENSKRTAEYTNARTRRNDILNRDSSAAGRELQEFGDRNKGVLDAAAYKKDQAMIDWYKDRPEMRTQKINGRVMGWNDETKTYDKDLGEDDGGHTPYGDWRRKHPDDDPINWQRAAHDVQLEGRRDPNAPKPMTRSQSVGIEGRKQRALAAAESDFRDPNKPGYGDQDDLNRRKQQAQDAYEAETEAAGGETDHFQYGSEPKVKPESAAPGAHATATTNTAEPTVKPEGGSTRTAAGGAKQLTLEKAKAYLTQAKGDKALAKKLAAKDGYQ